MLLNELFKNNNIVRIEQLDELEIEDNSDVLLNLDERIDNFIRWSNDNFRIEYNVFRNSTTLRSFIEKIAVWYELRYPDYEIKKMMFKYYDDKNVNDVMFYNNPYISKLKLGTSEYINFNWSDYYSKDVFYDSLTNKEQLLLCIPKYPELVYWNNKYSSHLHLYEDGSINQAERVFMVIPNVSDEELEGLHIKDVVKLAIEKGIKIPRDSEFIKAIENYNKHVYFRSELLNCVMYKMIERSTSELGARRAFLFALEFNLNIEIPLSYGIDMSDKYLKNFINEYIKAGGRLDLECLIGYPSREKKCEYLNTMTIRDILKKCGSDKKYYTDEERLLVQKFTDSVIKYSDDLNNEDVKKRNREK